MVKARNQTRKSMAPGLAVIEAVAPRGGCATQGSREAAAEDGHVEKAKAPYGDFTEGRS